MLFAVCFTLDGSGRACGGLTAGVYSRFVEAESFDEAIASLAVGKDCVKLEVIAAPA